MVLVEGDRNEEGHGKRERTKKLYPMLKQYGVQARRALPELEAYLKELESQKRPPKDLIPIVQETIEAIKASKDEVEMTSIREHLE